MFESINQAHREALRAVKCQRGTTLYQQKEKGPYGALK